MDFKDLIETKLKEKLDIVFIDPPYKTDYACEAIKSILEKELYREETIIIIESDQDKKIEEQLKEIEVEIVDKRKYGRAYLIFVKPKRKG